MSGTRGRYVTSGTNRAELARHQHWCWVSSDANAGPVKTGDTGGGAIRHSHIATLHCPTRVEHGMDRFNEQHTIAGSNQVTYKVSKQDTNGGLFVLEQVSMRKGGPPRHLHHSQEEWFYVMEGEYIFEVGEERMRLKPGDSLLAPRKVSHLWAYVGEGAGKILIAFQPAGRMEAFFQEAAKLHDFAAIQEPRPGVVLATVIVQSMPAWRRNPIAQSQRSIQVFPQRPLIFRRMTTHRQIAVLARPLSRLDQSLWVMPE